MEALTILYTLDYRWVPRSSSLGVSRGLGNTGILHRTPFHRRGYKIPFLEQELTCRRPSMYLEIVLAHSHGSHMILM